MADENGDEGEQSSSLKQVGMVDKALSTKITKKSSPGGRRKKNIRMLRVDKTVRVGSRCAVMEKGKELIF